MCYSEAEHGNLMHALANLPVLSESHGGKCNACAVGLSLHLLIQCTFSRWATAPSLEALMEPSQIDPARDKAKHMKQVGAWR